MSDRHTAHDGGEAKSEDQDTAAEDYRAGEHFGLTPEEERRGTPLQQEIATDVPVIAGNQDEPVPSGPLPGEPGGPDPAQPVPGPNEPDPMQPIPEPDRPDQPGPGPNEPDPMQPIPDPDQPDPMRPYPEPGDPDPQRPLPGGPAQQSR
jgi:hypothetical protein